jgi:hypothetical protein
LTKLTPSWAYRLAPTTTSGPARHGRLLGQAPLRQPPGRPVRARCCAAPSAHEDWSPSRASRPPQCQLTRYYPKRRNYTHQPTPDQRDNPPDDRATGHLLGLQLLGAISGEVAKRADTATAAIHAGPTIDELNDLELSYTPPCTPRAAPDPHRRPHEHRAGPLIRRLAAEALGTGLLATAVVSSGIAAARLSPGDVGLTGRR